MTIYLVDGHPSLDQIEAESWEAAERALDGKGSVLGELVAETKMRGFIPSAEFKFADDDAETRSFSGYGAIFTTTDMGADVIMPGAFKKSLADWKRRKALPPMLLQHRMHELPIGVWSAISEDERGLKVEGRLLDTTAGSDVYKAMAAKAIKGLSVGYIPRVVIWGTGADAGKRFLKEVDLFEISVVVLPMHPDAQVSQVKAAEEIKTIRDFEEFLREAGGFSNGRAKAIAAHGFKSFDAGRDDGEGELAAAIRRAAQTLKS